MQKRYNSSIYRKATNKCESRKIAIILGSIIFGCVCIIISSFLSKPWETNDNWRIIFNVILSTLATVAFAGVAWEGIVKYSFSRDVVDMVGLSERIYESGVFAIEESFSDIEWSELLEDAKRITAVFTYSTKWGKHNQDRIKKAVDNKCAFVVVLPDVNSAELIDALQYRFPDVKDIKDRINESEEFYRSMGAEIKHYSKALTSSFYIIDDVGIIVPFNHQKSSGGHALSVPAFLSVKPGHIYSFIEKEVDAILETTEERKEPANSENVSQ